VGGAKINLLKTMFVASLEGDLLPFIELARHQRARREKHKGGIDQKAPELKSLWDGHKKKK